MAKKSIETGVPLTYRQLQQANEENFQQAAAISPLSKMPAFKIHDPGDFIYEGPERSPLQQQGNGDYWGNSMWDNKTATPEEYESPYGLQDARANNQWLLAKWGSALGNAAVLAGTTYLDGTLGLLWGIGTAVAEKRWSGLWDNEVSNGLRNFEKMAQEELMPFYKTQESKERPWWENLGSVDFWADGFLKNMGFTIGALYSGGIFTKALKGLGALKNASSLGARFAGSAYSAINEGRIEANNNSRDFITNSTQILQQGRQDAINQIMANQDLSIQQKQDAIRGINDNFNSEVARVGEQAREMGNMDLLLNIPILMADNFYTFGKFYSKGFDSAKKSLGKGISKEANAAYAKSMNPLAGGVKQLEEAGKYAWNPVTTKQAIGKGLMSGLREGNEELAQGFAADLSANLYSDTPDTYYRAISDPQAKRESLSTMESLTKAFADTYGNADRYEEFAIGALTGLLGTPTFGRTQNADANTYLGRGKPIGISGGIFGEIADARYWNEQGEKQVSWMNKLQDRVKAGSENLMMRKEFNDAMNGYAAADDKFEYKNMEDNDMFRIINAYLSTGRKEDLIALTTPDFENMSQEELDNIAKLTSPDAMNISQVEGIKDTSGWKDANGNYITDTEEGTEKMRQALIDKREAIKEDIDMYEDALSKVRALSNNDVRQNEDAVTELAWMLWKSDKFKQRAASIYNDNGQTFDTINTALEDYQRAIRDAMDGKTTLGGKYRDDKLFQLATSMAEKKKKIQNAKDEKQAAQLQAEADLERKAVEIGLMDASNVSDVLTATKSISGRDKLDMANLASVYDRSRVFFDEMANNEEIYNRLLKGKMTLSDYQDALKSVSDLGKMATAYTSFIDRFNEYAKNPAAQKENREKIDKQKEKKEAVINKTQKRSNAMSMTREQFADMSIEELNNQEDALLGSKAATAEAALATIADVRKTKQYAAAALRNIEKALEQKKIEPEMYDKYADVINKAALTAPSADEFKVPDNFAFMAFADGVPMDEGQIAQMREFIDDAVKSVDSAPSGAGVSQEKIDEAIKNENKGKTTGHDSVDQVEDTDETRKKKAAKAKKEKEEEEKAKKRQQIIDKTMPVLNPFLFKLGQTGAIVPDNFEDLIKNVLGDIYDHITEDGLDDIKDIQDVLQHDLSYQQLNKALLGDEGTVPMASAIQRMLDLLNVKSSSKTKESDFIDDSNGAEEVEMTDEELKEANNNIQTDPASNPDPANYAEGTSKKNPEIAASWRPEIDEFFNERFGDHKGLKPTPFHETEDAKKFWGKDYKKKQAATKAIYDYLKVNHAFDNATNVKAKDKVYFVVDPALNKQVAEASGDTDAFVILMSSDPEGKVIIGSLPTSYTQAFTKNNVNYMYARTIKAYNEWDKTDHEPDAKFVSKETSYILKELPGGVMFTNSKSEETDQTLNQIFGQDLNSPQGFELVVVTGDKKGKYHAVSGKDTPVSDEIRGVISDKSARGYKYIIVPYRHGSSKGTAVPFILGRYNSKAMTSVLGKYIEQVLKNAISGKDIYANGTQIALKTALNNVFTDQFRVSARKGVFYVRRINKEPEPDGKHKSVEVFRLENPDDTNKLVDALLEEFAKNLVTSVRVNVNHINNTVEFNGENVPYNNLIGTLAHNNLAVPHTVNNWFTVAPLSRKGKPEEPERDTVTPVSVTQNERENPITYNENTYYVNKEGVIFDKDHNIAKGLSPKDTMLILAKNEIEIRQYPAQTGYPTSGVYTLNNGSLYDSNKEEIISDPQKIEEAKKKLEEKYKKENKEGQSLETSIPGTEEKATDNTVLADEDIPAEFFTGIKKKVRKELYNLLTDEQKEIVKEMNEDRRKWIVNELNEIYKGGDIPPKQIQEILNSTPKFREKVSDNYKPIDIVKEKTWLSKVLPQLSNNEHLRIVKGLIKIARSKDAGLAFGKFQRGMMTISDTGARGTVYHEAFHAVVDTLLNRKEKTELFTAGSNKYGIDPFERDADLEIEENLAEDFRKYVQREQIPLLGKAIRFFRSMKHIVQNWAGNEPYIQNVFYRINSGLMADRKVNTAVSAEDIANAKQEVINLYMSDINGKELTEEQIADINDTLQDISDSIGDVPWHLVKGNWDNWYIAGYNEHSVTAEDYDSPNLNTDNANEDNETIELDNDVAEYYNKRFAYENLSEDQSLILERNGISERDYNTLNLAEKQGLFRCMV